MTDGTVLSLWGKTAKRPDTGYHPLLFHMLDVGNVGRLLWEDCLPTALRRRIADGIGLPEEEAGDVVAVTCGLHDLGKASPAFQGKCHQLAKQVASHGLCFPKAVSQARHDHVTAAELGRYLSQMSSVVCRPSALVRVLSCIAGAHHGTFPRSENLEQFGRADLGGPEWTEARSRLVRLLIQLVCSKQADLPGFHREQLADPGLVLILAGLISVADWIGSSSEHFPVGADTPLEEYAAVSRERAQRALNAIGWLPALRPASPKTFKEVFPSLSGDPNALQQTISHLVVTRREPYLLVVEAPMGLGKTEAALYAADSALCSRVATGLYVALPTQATSSAMHRRVREEYLEQRGHSGIVRLQLAHGNAALLEEYNDIELTPIYGEERNRDAAASASAWFTARKRVLLAPFGVGTIDQALLSVLQTRHWFVRLFGLTRKIVIFDEVHAYDTYMTALLEHLIRWLAELDCTVVVLSATLPAARRRALLNAYRDGAADGTPVASYPRITWVAASGVGSTTVPVEPSWRRSVALQLHGNDNEPLAQTVRLALEEGGCGAVICNTVARAQDVYQVLRCVLPGWECLLFHARTPFGWRREREAQVLRMFGKDSARPRRAILVATQVVEQSLDLDFDWMASEMAPIDLLLQRMGRLWRRANTKRPASVTGPCFVVLCDSKHVGPPPAFGGSEHVYERYVLLRSWLAVRGRTEVDLPDDIEPLVEEVYGGHAPSPTDDEWQKALETARSEMLRRTEEAERQARRILVPKPGDPRDMIEKFSMELEEDDDPRVHPSIEAATRLGDPSVSLVCVLETDKGLLLPDGGSDPISLDVEPSAALTRRLLDSSLSLSHRGLFPLLKEQEPHRAWYRNPHLRFHRVIRLCNDEARVGGYRLRLDQDLGLIIRREEKK